MQTDYSQYIGMKINMLTVIDLVPGNGHNMFLCRCDCGNLTKRLPWSFIRNIKCVSCGCLHKNTSYVSKYIIRQFWTKLCLNGKQRDLTIDFPPEYLDILWDNQKEKCFWSNETITLPKTCYDFRDCNFTASVDRIDSNLGYSEGNVCFVSKKINFMKGSLSKEDFIEWCNLISDFNQ